MSNTLSKPRKEPPQFAEIRQPALAAARVAFARVAMIEWIAQAACEAREKAGVKPVHIAARADVGEATVKRFESATAWPRDPDQLLAAYADELGIDVRQIWRRGLELWHAANGDGPS